MTLTNRDSTILGDFDTPAAKDIKGQRRSQINKETSTFIQSTRNFRQSIYTQDRNRQKNLYTNMKRTAQINDPSTGLTDMQK